MSSGKLIVVRGLPGSGKSYLSGLLSSKYDGVILSTDDRVTSKNGVYLWSPSYIRQSHELNQKLCREAMRRGLTPIIDNTNTKWDEIGPYVALAKEFGYEVEIMEPETPWRYDVEECFRRNGHGVPLKSIKNMSDRWEDTVSIVEKVDSLLERI